ncbi:aldehyde dehydrogenase family protein [Frankia sp. Cppng1_Ct_nod]|uniref:aldehyde dehydrogenase family protein n=1 Tax=Frankia sp. Cppng1_Ct_nod TaxID=2897162 RepID=UPI002024BDEC|nr:aldehyde dehydrogenase family protein [Frankia sp. Cppng1_Ct_nod]
MSIDQIETAGSDRSLSTTIIAEKGGAVHRPAVEPGRLFINGVWRTGKGNGRREVLDPSTGQAVTTVVDGNGDDVDAAVQAARAAFDEGPWARMPGRERARILLRVADLIRKHGEELALLESVDVGKPIIFSRSIDVSTVVQQYEFFASQAQNLEGATRTIPIPSMAYTRPEPIGVVGAITPFNFPLILSNSKIAPALAAGNTIVHKPAEDTPLSALRMAELFAEAGIPDGVVNVVTGGAQVGEALVRHPLVDKIAFTGSTGVGRTVAGLAGQFLKPVTVELGGKAPYLIFDGADVEAAVGATISGFVFNTGQFCMGITRLLVARPLLDTVIEAVAAGAAQVPVGDPFLESTVVGPMGGKRHLAKVEEYVRIAREEPGARIVTGGQRLDLGGAYYAPTVVTGLSNDSRLVQEEIFGPVLTVQPFDTEDEAIALANSTPYGLAAGLHTGDVSQAHRVAARLQAGIVWVNSWALLDPAIPFGGHKQSGYGREYGPEALAEYTQVKSVVIPLG